MSSRQVVLVTGASSGIGQAIARALVARGLVVFGTSRHPESVEVFPGLEMLSLDVSDDRSARECVSRVLERAGRLDVLVNNAGASLAGAVEETTTEQARALFETNFFGTVRMVREVLPVLRRQGGGSIVNISSGMALARVPFLAFYSASKCALEGYSETLRHEVAPMNIRVSLIAPGFSRSRIAERSDQGRNPVPDYELRRRTAVLGLREAVSRGQDPARVADCVLRVITSRNPGFYHAVGAHAVSLPLLRRLLPERVFRAMIRRYARFGSQSGSASRQRKA